jgi:uncharacterized protein (TIGR02646 family)
VRQIRKGEEPGELAAWRAALRPRNAVPPWDEFGDPPRGAVRERLAADQIQLCCYCTGAIANGNYHIEHFKPRHPYRALTYRWKNLLASCESYRHPNVDGEIVETQRHCGEAKDDWFEEGVVVDPQHRDVESWFRYPLSGKVAASKQLSDARIVHVEKTIIKLNLNAPSLVARRRALLTLAGVDAAAMTRDRWLEQYLNPHRDAYIQEFWPALSYNYQKHWSVGFRTAQEQ